MARECLTYYDSLHVSPGVWHPLGYAVRPAWGWSLHPNPSSRSPAAYPEAAVDSFAGSVSLDHATALRALPEGIAVFDASGRLVLHNPSLLRLLGLSAAVLTEQLANGFDAFGLQQDGTPFPKGSHPLQISLRKGIPCSDVRLRVHRSGDDATWLSMNCQPLLEAEAASPYAVVASLRDITSSSLADEVLEASESRYRLLSRATSEVVYDWDIGSDSMIWGTGVQTVFQYEKAQPSGAWWRERIHPDDREGVRRSLTRAMEGGAETSHVVYRFLRADGSYGIIADRCLLVRDQGGCTVQIIGAMSDITVRKRAEDRLRLLSSIAMGVRSGMSVDDVIRYVVRQMHEHFPDLRVTYSSIDQAGRFQVLCCQQPPGMPDLAAFHGSLVNSPLLLEVYRLRGPLVFEDVPDNPLLRPIMNGWKTGTHTALAMPLRHGERLMGALSLASSIAREWGQHEMDVLREVSDYLTVAIAEATAEAEREQALSELEISRSQFRELAHQLQVARERERTRVAREIHDVLGQALTALQMEVALLLQHRRADKGRGQKLLQLIDVTVESVQRLVADLRPSQLDDLGLRAAIEWAIGEFQERWRIPCERQLPSEDLPLTSDQSTVIFRILQEALTNVARHAEANRVEIHLARRAGFIRLDVADNGRGIAEGSLSSPNSLGLIGMRERAVALGGRVEVRSNPAKGTRLTLLLPIEVPPPTEVPQ